jgi:hypothetical protein
MGRASVPLQQFIAEKGLEDEFWLPLGKGDWTNLEGPVSGPGRGCCAGGCHCGVGSGGAAMTHPAAHALAV